MAVGYLITVILLGAGTCCALWPPGTATRNDGSRPAPRWGAAAYLLGMTFSEAPLFPLLIAASSTALAAAEGQLQNPWGVAGAAGMALVAGGLLLVAARAVRSRAAAWQSLDRDVGAYTGSAPKNTGLPGPRRPGYGLAVLGLLMPFRRRRRDVRRIANLHYGGPRRRLDLYLPRRQPVTGGVFIHFHGGRFVSGAKSRESLYLLHRLAAHGWACISADYTLAPAGRFPEYVVDAKRVIAWVRSSGPEYGTGSGPVIVAGNSAGAFLAAFAALTPNRPELQPGFKDADTSVAGAVCLYGYYGRVHGSDPQSSALARIHAGAPPFFILHGDRDSIVPVEHGRGFARALATVSLQPVAWCVLPGAQHSFDYFASVRARCTAEAIERFVGWVQVRGERRVEP